MNIKLYMRKGKGNWHSLHFSSFTFYISLNPLLSVMSPKHHRSDSAQSGGQVRKRTAIAPEEEAVVEGLADLSFDGDTVFVEGGNDVDIAVVGNIFECLDGDLSDLTDSDEEDVEEIVEEEVAPKGKDRDARWAKVLTSDNNYGGEELSEC